MSRLTRDGTAESVSRDQILRRERGQGNICFPCSADHEQDWQPYPVDPYSSIYLMAIHTSVYYIHSVRRNMLLIGITQQTEEYVSSAYSRESFNDWGGRGYDDSVPGEAPKTTPSEDRTT